MRGRWATVILVTTFIGCKSAPKPAQAAAAAIKAAIGLPPSPAAAPALGPELLTDVRDEGAAPTPKKQTVALATAERRLRALLPQAERNFDPVLRHDGKQIAFVHADADGADATAEVYTIDVTGGDVRQVTRLGLRADAPAYHPGGDYLAFVTRETANGPATAWVIDRLGRQDPLIVARDLDGSVEPEFDANGGGLALTLERADGTRVRRYGRWNDRLARRRLGQRPIAPLAAANTRAWVEYLADPYFEGRPAGGARESEYNAAIANAFRELGLKPFGPGFEVPFGFVTQIELAEKNDFEMHVGEATIHLALSGDYIPTSFSAEGVFPPAPIVFAGYGLVAVREGAEAPFDSYGDLDVRDKWVAIFEGLPRRLTSARRFFLHQHGRLLERILHAQSRGAAGVLVLDDPSTEPSPPRLRTEGRPDGIQIPILRLARRPTECLFASERSTVDQWMERLARGEAATLAFTRASANAVVNFVPKLATARNVVGILKVPNATRAILIGAHADGPGRGERGGSLDPKPDVVLPAANDNASGVAALIKVAALLKARGGELKQDVIFAAWSGAEMGSLGAQAFALRRPNVTASLNLSAVGAAAATLTVRGISTSADWPVLLDPFKPAPIGVEALPPDDAARFAEVDVPSLTITTGAFASDRTAADQPERVDYASIDKVISFADALAARLTKAAWPQLFIRSPDRGD